MLAVALWRVCLEADATLVQGPWAAGVYTLLPAAAASAEAAGDACVCRGKEEMCICAGAVVKQWAWFVFFFLTKSLL